MDHKTLAVKATFHCAIGCQIGETTGMIFSSIFNFSNSLSFIISIMLAFIFGYALTIIPMIRSGISLKRALALTFASDTLSIASMETGDNLTLFLIPGSLNATIKNPLFWQNLLVSLIIGIIVALPVNYFLIKHGKGHSHHH